MTPKQMIGLIFVAVGVVMIIFSFHVSGLVEKRLTAEAITHSPISPTERVPEGVEIIREESKKGWYWIMVGGATLIVLGGGVAVRFRK